jgi:hypothetical protein
MKIDTTFLALIVSMSIFGCQQQSQHTSERTQVPYQFTTATGAVLTGNSNIQGDFLFVDRDMELPLHAKHIPNDSQSRGNYNPAGQLWSNGYVKYKILPGVSDAVVQKIHQAMAPWRAIGFDFLLSTNATDAVEVKPPYYSSQWACAATVGYTGQATNYWAGSDCTLHDYIHEWGHILGFYHEAQRSDRDQYIDVFDIGSVGILKGQVFGDYDFDSIMHYDAFKRDMNGNILYDQLSFRPKASTGRSISSFGFTEQLSLGDVEMARALYPMIVNRPRPIPVPKR